MTTKTKLLLGISFLAFAGLTTGLIFYLKKNKKAVVAKPASLSGSYGSEPSNNGKQETSIVTPPEKKLTEAEIQKNKVVLNQDRG